MQIKEHYHQDLKTHILFSTCAQRKSHKAGSFGRHILSLLVFFICYLRHTDDERAIWFSLLIFHISGIHVSDIWFRLNKDLKIYTCEGEGASELTRHMDGYCRTIGPVVFLKFLGDENAGDFPLCIVQ